MRAVVEYKHAETGRWGYLMYGAEGDTAAEAIASCLTRPWVLEARERVTEHADDEQQARRRTA